MITGLKEFPRMGIVYDNGFSFILYYPGDITHLELFEK
jgi:hypothetical protein